METTLNLAWLGVTVALVWLWRFRWAVSRRDPRSSPNLEVVALVCVLALLFPVISLTDDLHPEIVAVDSVSGKRNARLIAAASVPRRDVTAHWGTQLISALLSRAVPGASLASTRFEMPLRLLASTFTANTRFGRSPPSLL
jgi:hypothetical protein